MTIRAFASNDDVVALTEMLHRSYAPLAARGLRYVASHQSPEMTVRRLSRGYPFVAESEGRVVGTITVYRADPKAKISLYRDPHTYHFGQFGIEPEHKGRGIGRALHQAVIDYALGQGARFMALDTAAPATDLIAMYERWRYAVVDRTRWESTNYESVLMRRCLAAGSTSRIRMIESRDLTEIFEVRASTRENSFSREALRQIGITEESTAEMLRMTHRGWLCEEDGRIVGFAIGDGKTGELWVIAVLPEFEGRGIGSQLLAAVEGWLLSLGWQELWLWTSSDPKTRAFSFYLKRGWTVSESKTDSVYMKKKRPGR